MTEDELISDQSEPKLSPVLIHLFKGVLYKEMDAKLWSYLLQLLARVREYVQVIGLELVLDEAEGYAFLRSRDDDAAIEQGTRPLPRLIIRQPLSFPVSLLLALLRKRMAEEDSSGGETRLILTREEIASLMRIFLAESSNEARIIDQIDANIGKVIKLGFLRKLKSNNTNDEPVYEVMRILKAFIDAQWLAEFDTRLAEYAQHVVGNEDRKDG